MVHGNQGAVKRTGAKAPTKLVIIRAMTRSPSADSLSSTDLAILRVLWYDYAQMSPDQTGGTCHPSIEEIATVTRFSTRSVYRSLTALRDAGFLTIEGPMRKPSEITMVVTQWQNSCDTVANDNGSCDTVSQKIDTVAKSCDTVARKIDTVANAIKEEPISGPIREPITEPTRAREAAAVAAQADRLVGCEAPPDLTTLAKRLAEVYPRVSGNSFRRAFIAAAQSEAADSGRTVLEAAEWIVERAEAHWAVAVGHDPGAKTNRLVKRLDNWLADGCYGSDPDVTMGHLGPEPDRHAPMSFEQVRKQEEEAQMERAMAIYREQNGAMA